MRINLYFPDDHVLAQMPQKGRAKQVKAMIEFALIHKKRVEKLEEDSALTLEILAAQSKKLDKVINLLESAEISTNKEVLSNGIGSSSEDILLIDQMLNIFK